VDRRIGRLRVGRFGVVQRQRPDGHTLELRRNSLPDGGFVTLYADITEHKQAEEALRRAQAAAEAANDAKSRFVAIVSHEIRTPLNALLNTIRLLGDSVLAPAQRSLLTMARQSGDVLFGLINDILDISQMEAGKLAIRPSLFELRPLLESCIEMFADQAAERGMTIRVAIAKGTPVTVFTDPGRLRQVQLNLLSNAMKYARQGEVWLTAEPVDDPGYTSADGAPAAIRLTVQDDGPVIAPEARERLFRPFSRLDRPDGDSTAGTGLGLSICHHLVSLMGGQIGCEPWRSDDGLSDIAGVAREGNAFWMVLPAAVPAHGSVSAAGAPAVDQAFVVDPDPMAEVLEAAERAPPRTRVLLADDIVVNQVVTATLLRRAGHYVDVVPSGDAAIKALQTAPYDLVFMDIFMPGMSGQEATQIIRTLPEPARSTPIIALTANVGAEDEALFKAAGMDGLVGKPVSPEALLGVLREHVWRGRPSDVEQAASLEGPDSEEWPGTTAVLAGDRIRELRANLAPDIFANLVEECLLDMDHRLPALRRAVLAGAPAAITAHAHTMIGMAAGYGMAALEMRLRSIMTAAREGDLASLGPSSITGVETDFAEAARLLRAIPRHEVA